MVGWRAGRGHAGSGKGREDIAIHEISIVRGTDIIHAGKVRAVPTDTDDKSVLRGGGTTHRTCHGQEILNTLSGSTLKKVGREARLFVHTL